MGPILYLEGMNGRGLLFVCLFVVLFWFRSGELVVWLLSFGCLHLVVCVWLCLVVVVVVVVVVYKSFLF